MKSLGLLFGVGIAGVFVGALTVEIIHRVRPNLIRNLQSSTRKAFSDIGEAFKEGYHGMGSDIKKLSENL
jgi:hypothetical protein